MGRAERAKGARGERDLIKELNSLGFRDARRLYTLGWKGKAQQGGITKGGDVIAGPPGDPKEIIFEVKLRRKDFGLMYALLDLNGKNPVGAWDETEKLGFYCSYSVYDLLTGSGVKQLTNIEFFTDKKLRRGINGILRMRKWLGEASILVIKKDHKPFLYIKYYD